MGVRIQELPETTGINTVTLGMMTMMHCLFQIDILTTD
jgi:hypothetical protein